MSFIVRAGNPMTDPAPEGLYPGVCVQVVDLGLVDTQWGTKHKCEIVFQIQEVNPKTSKRFEVSQKFNAVLTVGSSLRDFLEAWRGKKFSDDEASGFDIDRLIGINAQVQVIHNIGKQGGVFANVNTILPAPKGAPVLVPENYSKRPSPGVQGTPNAKPALAMPVNEEDVPF